MTSVLPERRWPGPEGGGFVCVSGLGGAVGEWERVAPTLARRGAVVAVDIGRAATGERGNPLQAGSRVLERVLEREDGRPAVLIGHSMGALVALRAASGASSRPAGLVLTAPFLPLGTRGRSRLGAGADYLGHRVLYVAGAARRRPGSRRRDVSVGERLAGLRSLAHYGLRPKAFHALADRVECPVLLVHGRRDHYVPPAFARAAAARHPTWQLQLVPHAGHFPHRDHPGAWLATVQAWLDSTGVTRPAGAPETARAPLAGRSLP